jgi:hypothetical protein
MQKEMLKHQQMVLMNVSHSEELFTKELFKSIGWLGQAEIWMLKRWLEENYYESHGDIIRSVFERLQQLEDHGIKRLVIPETQRRV